SPDGGSGRYAWPRRWPARRATSWSSLPEVLRLRPGPALRRPLRREQLRRDGGARDRGAGPARKPHRAAPSAHPRPPSTLPPRVSLPFRTTRRSAGDVPTPAHSARPTSRATARGLGSAGVIGSGRPIGGGCENVGSDLAPEPPAVRSGMVASSRERLPAGAVGG